MNNYICPLDREQKETEIITLRQLLSNRHTFSDYWTTAFGLYSDADKKRIINSLGNMLLLSSGSENSSLKNYSFPVKKDMSVSAKKFAYCDGSRSAREIASNECWTINEVNDRLDVLIKFM